MSLFRKKSDDSSQAKIRALRAEIAKLKAVRDAQKLKIVEQKRRLKRWYDLKIPMELDHNADGLAVWNKNVTFTDDERFKEAYASGILSGHIIGGSKNVDLQIYWRVHVALWAASHALRLPGDLVECGVNTGNLSLAICQYTDFNATGRSFYLFDTYCGIPKEHISDPLHHNYEDCYEVAKANFSPYPNATLVKGMIPDSLSYVDIGLVSYLSIDMNNVAAETAAIEHFWPKLVTGAVVLLDDYGWKFAHLQKDAMDKFARSVGVEILALPTGQGLLLKP